MYSSINEPCQNTKRRSATLNADIADFIDCMYAQDINMDYRGYTGIYLISWEYDRLPYYQRPKKINSNGKIVRDRGQKNIRLVTCRHPDELPETAQSLYYIRQDTYIQKNRFKSPNTHCKSDLFGYSNIVIDIDRHCMFSSFSKADTQKRIDELMYALQEILFEDPDFPMPNAVVYTGRGIQLWWHLVPTYAMDSTSAYYQAVVQYFIDKINAVLNVQFEDFSIDVGASKNEAGLVRLPGTFNTKSCSYGGFTIYHCDAMDLKETAESLPCTEKKMKPAVKKSKSILFAERRERQLSKLFELRQKNGMEDDVGTRDFYLFFIFNAYLSAGASKEEAERHMLAFNSKFQHPMPEREIMRYMSSSIRNEGYRCTNEKVADDLHVTEEEQALIGMFQIYVSKKTKKKERNDKILSANCMTEKEAAEQAQCSESTVSRTLKKEHKTSKRKKIRSKILAALKRGQSVASLLKKYAGQISRSGIYYLKKKADAWIAKKNAALAAKNETAANGMTVEFPPMVLACPAAVLPVAVNCNISPGIL